MLPKPKTKCTNSEYKDDRHELVQEAVGDKYRVDVCSMCKLVVVSRYHGGIHEYEILLEGQPNAKS